MAGIYADATVNIRADLVEAHLKTIEAWAAPGNHWSGAERLAIANEVRRARAADELPPWIGPTTIDGLIDEDHILPKPAIDAVWRLTNHSGTLTQDWYTEITDRGLTPGEYVELVSIVATANSMEVFAASLGMAPPPLPGPVEGEPDRALTPDAEVSTHWVPTAPIGGPNVRKALTLVPVAIEAWTTLGWAQYLPADVRGGDLNWSRGALDRMQVELLAARTSLLNECFY